MGKGMGKQLEVLPNIHMRDDALKTTDGCRQRAVRRQERVLTGDWHRIVCVPTRY